VIPLNPLTNGDVTVPLPINATFDDGGVDTIGSPFKCDIRACNIVIS